MTEVPKRTITLHEILPNGSTRPIEVNVDDILKVEEVEVELTPEGQIKGQEWKQ